MGSSIIKNSSTKHFVLFINRCLSSLLLIISLQKIVEWSANKISEKFVSKKHFAEKSSFFSSSGQKWLAWESTWYLSQVIEIRLSSWAGTKKHWTIKWNFYHFFCRDFAPTGDRWFSPQSCVSDRLRVLFLVPFLMKNRLDRPEKKAICERGLSNFLRKTMFYCSLHTKVEKHFSFKRTEWEEVRFNCW